MVSYISVFIFLCGLLIPTRAVAEDPCIMALGVVDPGSAMALQAKQQQTKQDMNDHFDKGRGIKRIDNRSPGQNEADAQNNRREASYDAGSAGDFEQMSVPMYTAGAAKANPMIPEQAKAKQILTLCVQRRSAQANADKTAADKNRRYADMAARGQTGAGGYDAKVIRVDGTLPPR